MCRPRRELRASFPLSPARRAGMNTYYFSSSFSLSPATRTRTCTRARAYARGRGEGGKEVGSYLAQVASRGPREQPRIQTEFVALGRSPARPPRGAPRWAVGQRTPPVRPGLRLGRPVGPGAAHVGARATRRGRAGRFYGLGGPVATWANGARLGRTGGWDAVG